MTEECESACHVRDQEHEAAKLADARDRFLGEWRKHLRGKVCRLCGILYAGEPALAATAIRFYGAMAAFRPADADDLLDAWLDDIYVYAGLVRHGNRTKDLAVETAFQEFVEEQAAKIAADMD